MNAIEQAALRLRLIETQMQVLHYQHRDVSQELAKAQAEAAAPEAPETQPEKPQ